MKIKMLHQEAWPNSVVLTDAKVFFGVVVFVFSLCVFVCILSAVTVCWLLLNLQDVCYFSPPRRLCFTLFVGWLVGLSIRLRKNSQAGLAEIFRID